MSSSSSCVKARRSPQHRWYLHACACQVCVHRHVYLKRHSAHLSCGWPRARPSRQVAPQTQRACCEPTRLLWLPPPPQRSSRSWLPAAPLRMPPPAPPLPPRRLRQQCPTATSTAQTTARRSPRCHPGRAGCCCYPACWLAVSLAAGTCERQLLAAGPQALGRRQQAAADAGLAAATRVPADQRLVRLLLLLVCHRLHCDDGQRWAQRDVH